MRVGGPEEEVGGCGQGSGTRLWLRNHGGGEGREGNLERGVDKPGEGSETLREGGRTLDPILFLMV